MTTGGESDARDINSSMTTSALEPTVASHGVLSASGTLRGGTGRFTLVGIPTGGAPVEVHLVGGGGSAPTAALTARLAVVRTR